MEKPRDACTCESRPLVKPRVWMDTGDAGLVDTKDKASDMKPHEIEYLKATLLNFFQAVGEGKLDRVSCRHLLMLIYVLAKCLCLATCHCSEAAVLQYLKCYSA